MMVNAVKKIESTQVVAEPISEATAIISMIERAARDPAVDIEKMERLFKMQQEVSARRAKTEYLAAFAKLQADLPAAARRGTGHNNKKYARFEDVIEALRGPLSAHGFSLQHHVDTAGNIIRVTGILGHAAGHTEQTTMTLPPDTSGNKTAVHAMASAISYGKRYVTLTLTGIATDDDDDGRKAGATFDQLAPISNEQAEILTALITETKSNVGKFLEVARAESVSDILAKDFDGLKKMLVTKKGNAK